MSKNLTIALSKYFRVSSYFLILGMVILSWSACSYNPNPNTRPYKVGQPEGNQPEVLTSTKPGASSDAALSGAPNLSGRSYVVKGKQYHILATADGFQEEGLATWYGPGFHGRKTANGEIFDINKITAAHKTLPMGTMVEVTNLDNNEKIVVRINDRGPFGTKKHIIDLSKKAAREIGVLGVSPVSIKVVAPAEKSGEK